MSDRSCFETTTPVAVQQGWTDSVRVGPYRLLFYPSGVVRFEHRCDRGERGVIICAPALGDAHRVERDPRPRCRNTVNVTPSIHCTDCGTHGFIRLSEWVST